MIHPSERVFFQKLFANHILPQTLAESRERLMHLPSRFPQECVENSQDFTIRARDGFPIPIALYNAHLPPEAPLVIYMMGNGYIYDLFAVNRLIAGRMAQYAAVRVAVINMRLAPENPLPRAIQDAYDAVATLAVPGVSLSLVGFCSGASCALAVTHEAFARQSFFVKHLILLNGMYDLTFGPQDYQSYDAKDLSLSAESVRFIVTQQGLSSQEKQDPRYSPLWHQDFSFLPQTTLLVAQYDRNRSCSEAFYKKVHAYNPGIIHKIELEGQTHNSILFYPLIPGILDPARIIMQVLEEEQ